MNLAESLILWKKHRLNAPFDPLNERHVEIVLYTLMLAVQIGIQSEYEELFKKELPDGIQEIHTDTTS